MARPRRKIPQYIQFDMQDLFIKQASMNDEELGGWFRKAVSDCMSGCTAKDVDPMIRERYENALEKMTKKQSQNADFYEGHKDNGNKAPAADSAQSNRVDENPTNTAEPTHSATKHTGKKSGKSAAVATIEKKAYGEYKNVMLSDEEGHKLRELYGSNLEMAIQFLDDYIQQGSKKARAYKDHFLVMKKNSWVWTKVQEQKIQDARLQKAENGGKSFEAQERERQGMICANLLAMGGI